MRLLFFLMILICSNVYSQNSQRTYDDIILEIRNSKELLDFSSEHNIDKIKFKISEHLYPFCQNYNLFKKDDLNENIINHCLETDLLSEEFIKEPYLKNKCDKGRKTAIMYISKVLDGYIISEVVLKNIEQESLLFLFKLDGNNIKKIESIKIHNN